MRSVCSSDREVRGVLNSCAIASSSVDFNSSLCLATSARFTASCEIALSSPIATRFNNDCKAAWDKELPRTAKLPIWNSYRIADGRYRPLQVHQRQPWTLSWRSSLDRGG